MISCFDDFFFLIKCKSWIDEWLLFKSIPIHLINDYTCLYVDGVRIVVVCEVWMKMRKYEFLVKNRLDDDFEVN